jgi:hypothetical protein
LAASSTVLRWSRGVPIMARSSRIFG